MRLDFQELTRCMPRLSLFAAGYVVPSVRTLGLTRFISSFIRINSLIGQKDSVQSASPLIAQETLSQL